MIEMKNSKVGHRKTKLGWIPIEWDLSTIKESFVIVNGKAFKPKDWKSQGIPIIRIQNLNSEKASFNYYDGEVEEKYHVRKGDLLFAWAGSIGVSFGARVWNREDAYLNQHIFKVYPINNLDKDFALYLLLNVQRSIERKAHGFKSTFVHVKKSEFEKTLLLIPSFSEQKKIASILSNWDNAIEKLRQIIEAKEKQKKGLMQTILIGKKRLLNYKSSWKEVHLGEIFNERREVGYNDLPLLAITGNKGVIYRDQLVKKDNSNNDKSKYKRICIGDIGYNTMRLWQGRSAVSSLEGIVSPAYTIITPKEGIDINYMGYFFQHPKVIHTFWRYSQGLVSDTLNCKFPNFAKIKIFIPSSKEEQIAIAKIFIIVDRELKLLNEKMEEIKEQKKGLMQRLLTGKIRVNN